MKKSKVMSIFILAILVLAILSNFVLAIDPSTITGDTSNTGLGTIKTTGGKIVGFIQVIGSIVSVAVLVVLGIKYMMGSSEEKAEYKKTMLPYLIGAVVVFAASNIAGMVFNFASTI